MKRSFGALFVALLTFGLAAPGRAQEPEGYVLAPGLVRLSAGGEYAGFNQVYGPSGREAFGSARWQPLVPANFAPLRPLEASLATFLAATASRPGATPFVLGPNSLSLGTADVAIFASHVRVPLRLDVGVLPRVQIGVSLPIQRGDLLVQRVGVSGASVGENPNATANAALLGRLGANGAQLGASALLPTSESPAGRELQRRVLAATGSSLQLPRGDSVAGGVLQRRLVGTFGDSIVGSRGRWHPGDLEIDARVMLLDGVGGEPLPAGRRGIAYRLALAAGVRLPTGTESDTVAIIRRDVQAGLAGAQIGLLGDAFVGRRWWIGFGVREVFLPAASVLRRVVPPDAPLSRANSPEEVDWNPPDTLELRVTPRYRIARSISIGGDYRVGWLSASSHAGSAAGVLDTPGGLAQRVGLGLRFTSLPAYAGRETGLPIEAMLSYSRSLSGPEGSMAESGLELRGSILTSLWGRGLRH
ncbi:MAG: hypothetical protein KY464_16840 [Gemmatimonadetes bacterium]|nr:hypothetical protein [Gemmatimonadota bacterium]